MSKDFQAKVIVENFITYIDQLKEQHADLVHEATERESLYNSTALKGYGMCLNDINEFFKLYGLVENEQQ